MERKKPGFRLVSDKEMQRRTLGGQLEVVKILGKYDPCPSLRYEDFNGKMVGVAKGNKLIALCLYEPLTKMSVHIQFIWNRPKTLSYGVFRKEFGVSPAQFLLERFVRTGVKKFVWRKPTVRGKAFINRLKKSRLIKEKALQEPVWKKATQNTITSLWLKRARLRKRILI